MAFTPLLFLLTLATVEVMVVTGETGSQVSRQKRSDDGGPLETVVEHLSQQVTSINAQLTSLHDELTAVNSKMAALETRPDNLEKTVAFSAIGGTNPVTASGHGRIPINQVQLNIGNAFDSEIGYFTAPVSGIYHFTAAFLNADHSTHGRVFAEIIVDGQRAAYAVSDSTQGTDDDQSMQAVVHVSAGKKVYVRNPSSLTASYYGEWHLAFSGFLVRAD